DSATRAKLLRELAGLHESKLRKPHEAVAALLRAFQADPTEAAMRDVERMANEAGEFSGVVRAYRAAGLTLEGEERNRMFLRAGALAEKSGDLAGSVVDYLRVLGLSDEGDKTALAGLKRVVQRGLPPERFREAAAQVVAGMEEAQLTSYWRELAQFFERDMQSANDAIAAWKEVLKLHTGDPQATGELDRLYATTTDPRQLVEHLRGKMDATDDDTVRAAMGGQIAEIMADRLGDINGAIAELVRVGERLPGKPMVWRRLGDLYLRAAQPQQAAQCLHRELGLLPEGDERHGRLAAYADLLGNKLGDVATALSALQGVTTVAPAHAEALAVLERLAAAPTDPATAAAARQMLGAGLNAAGRFKEAAQLMAAEVEETTDPQARSVVLRQLAKIKAERLSDARGAYADLERAFRDVPLDADLRAELERLADAAQAWPQLAEAYRAALGVVSDAGVQKTLQRKLAEVLDKKLGRAAEAIEHYRAATGGQLPDDLPSLEAMERLLRAQNRQAELVDVLAAIASKLLPADKARRQMILFEVAALAETALADKDRAVDTYKILVELDAKDMRPLRKLEQLLGGMGRAEEQSAVLEKLVALGTANPEAAEDLVKLAQACAERGMVAEAVKHFRTVLLKKREHAAALAGLEQLMAQAENKLEIAQILEPIYTTKQDHEKLAWVLEARLDATQDKAQRKGLLRRIGDIFENRLNQREHAFVLARRSLGEDPADMGVRMWIEKLAGETGLLAELAAAYAEEAARAEPQLALQFHRRAAALYHEKLNDASSAVTAYKASLAIDPRDEKALAGMEALLRGSAQAADLVDLLRQRVGATAGVERKREYLNEIATLQLQQLKDPGAAVQTYQEILATTPDDINAFGQIEQLLAQTGAWDELGQLYDRELVRLADKKGRDAVARRLEYTYRRGRVLDEQFSEREQAKALFEQVLAESPGHASTVTYLEARAKQGVLEAMTLLEQVYAAANQWQKYVELLQLKLNHTPESELRRLIFLTLTQVFDERLKVGDMAFRALALAYRENRTDLELIERLEEMAGRYGQWPEVVALLGTDVDAVPDAASRQHHLRRLGAISGEHLKDVQRATAYLQAALQYDPRDDQALAALDALLERNQMWAALADLLERRIDLAGEPSAKSRLLERLAVVWSDHLMDAEAALRCHQQILEIDPDHPISLKSMQKLYAEVQDWDSLAKNLQRQAEVLTSKEDQVRVHAAAGKLYAEELGDNAIAIDHWLKVVEVNPAHGEANQALEVLLSAEERWDELATHYQRMLAATQDAGQKSDINRRLGMILSEKLGRTEDALTSWLEVLRAQPKNVDALRALLKLYNDRAMWKELVEIARRAIPLVDPGEAKEVRIVLAKALGENLGARDEAIKIAREVRATEPHTAEQLTRLALTLKNIEAFDEAVVTIEKAAALETDAGAKIALFYEAAELYVSRLNKPNDAKIAYESIRAAEPTDPNAYSALADIYRATADWRKLVQLHEDFLPHADASLRQQMFREIRDVHDEKLGEKEMAFIAACRAFKENPADLDSAQALERLGAATEAGEELVAVMEDEVDNIGDVEARVAVLRRIARIYADYLKDTSSAEAALNRILSLAPADVEALDAMAALGARDDRYDKQIAALESKLSAVSDSAQRKVVLYDIARIWEEQIGEVDEAVKALNRVLEIDGSDKGALEGLARLYEHEQRWAELAHTLTRKVELTQDAAENVTLRMRVGALCEAELGDHEAAIEWYRGVLEFDAAHAGALSALERLYTGQERWSELLQAFELQVNATGDKDEKIKILSKMASIYEAEFDSSKDAAACYEQIYALDNTHVASLKHLERLLRALGEWNRLIEIVQHHITLVSG
ncbi:MAG: hypothetical protein HYZ27_07045, partial [Deltaproteobacteria bacterium]|nr:hypothetical protein [Deltaproteobacteria bacterium]